MKRSFSIGALVAATVLFGGAIAARDRFDPWASNSIAGMVAIAGATLGLRPRLGYLLAFRPLPALVAAGLGAALVVATHVGFHLTVELFPSFDHTVTELYRDIRSTSPGPAAVVPLILMIVVAEELMWRGLAVELCGSRVSERWAAVVSVALYTLPQLIGGSWVLIAAAVGLGSIFTKQRLSTGRLTEAIITHGIWSVSIFGLAPLV